MTATECFSVVQNKRMSNDVSVLSLCPSMDLLCLQSTIHRTVNWQTVGQMHSDICKTVTWHPQGQYVASVCIDDDEGFILRVSNMHDVLTEEGKEYYEIPLPRELSVLCWTRVSARHPLQKMSEDEELYMLFQQNCGPKSEPWRFRSAHSHGATAVELNPTPTLLVGMTKDQTRIQGFKGPYGVLDVDVSGFASTSQDSRPSTRRHKAAMIASSIQPRLQVSLDMSKILVLKSDMLLVSQIPPPEPMEEISRWYARVQRHLNTLESHISTVPSQWETCLQPLDQKFKALQALLTQYGLDTNLRRQLRYYLIRGATNTDLPNALDQFWTSMACNDQLLQKLERTLSSALANVESQVNQHWIAPTRALVQECYKCPGAISTGNNLYLSRDTYQSWRTSIEQWYVSVQEFRDELVRARQCAQDVVAWLRGMASQCKARGTAPASVQRQQAKQRRASPAVQARIQEYLKDNDENISNRNMADSYSTEDVWQLGLSRFWKSLPKLLERVSLASRDVFDEPRQYFSDRVLTSSLQFPSAQVHAIHMRRGRGDFMEEPTELDTEATAGFWDLPNARSSQYMVIARTTENNCVDMYAMALSWRSPTITGDEEDTSMNPPAFQSYYACRLLLPTTETVQAVEFYGDDGNTKETSTGKEGRQALVILTKSNEGERRIWLVDYDNAPFPLHDCQDTFPIPSSSVEVAISGEEQEDRINVIYARTRLVTGGDGKFQMAVSGSRGVAALASHRSNVTVLELLDLEEDEESEDESDGMDE